MLVRQHVLNQQDTSHNQSEQYYNMGQTLIKVVLLEQLLPKTQVDTCYNMENLSHWLYRKDMLYNKSHHYEVNQDHNHKKDEYLLDYVENLVVDVVGMEHKFH